jgi:hypothetical protein
MTVLQIEHKVPNFDGWKKAFQADPIDRQKSGVKSYRIYRPVNDDNYVIIDLVFDSTADAESVLASLRKLWNKVEGTVMTNPQTRILSVVEAKEY